MTIQPAKEKWGSRIGVIMAVAGSAVGLGNFLRFPGQAAQNGGGAFMLPYFVALLVLGIPLAWAEWTMGRYGGTRGFNSAPGIYWTIWRRPIAKYFGGLALLIPLIIFMYYVLIEAWCLNYAWKYINGSALLPNNAQEYEGMFNSMVGKREDGAVFSGHGELLGILIFTFFLNFYLIYRGVTKGIEAFCRVAMPMMVLLGLVVLLRVLTLGTPAGTDRSVLDGLGFMWNPQPERLFDARTWLAASGQIFFSLSVGFGIVVNYASYLSEKDDVVLSGLTSCSMNEFFEVCLGGLITIPAAFIFLGASAAQMGTFGLGFVALPNVFDLMWGGRLVGAMWFLLLFIAAVTSSVSMLQPVIAFLEEGFDLKRHSSSAFLGLIGALGCSFVAWFSKDLVALDTFDFWVGSVLIITLALIQSLLYGWALGIERAEQEAHRGAHLRIPRFVQWMLKFVVPVYLGLILVVFCYQQLPSSNQIVVKSVTPGSLADEAGIQAGDVLQRLEGRPVSTQAEWQAAAEQAAGESARLQVLRNQVVVVLDAPADLTGAELEFQHQAGYIERIQADPAARMSIFFIATVLVFLLVMVHIAGRRWVAQGRLAPQNG